MSTSVAAMMRNVCVWIRRKGAACFRLTHRPLTHTYTHSGWAGEFTNVTMVKALLMNLNDAMWRSVLIGWKARARNAERLGFWILIRLRDLKDQNVYLEARDGGINIHETIFCHTRIRNFAIWLLPENSHWLQECLFSRHGKIELLNKEICK